MTDADPLRRALAQAAPGTTIRIAPGAYRGGVFSQGRRKATTYRMYMTAWAGGSDVAAVEISGNGGGAWAEAKLLGEPVRYDWRY